MDRMDQRIELLGDIINNKIRKNFLINEAF